MLRELEMNGASQGTVNWNTKGGHKNFRRHTSDFWPHSLTFAVLSQTAGSGVLTVEKYHPFLHGHFVKGKIKDYAR